MARLYLFAEGETEQAFAGRVLRRHLADFGIDSIHVMLVAHGRRKGRVHRGGGRNYLPLRDDIRNRLAQEKKNRDVFFTTMFDLYAIHASFPGREEAERLRHLPNERVEFLEKAFADDIRDTRFIPYLQLHEFEAYLFCDPTQFEFFYTQHTYVIRAIQQIAGEYPTPEYIDDGPDSAPSKRILALIPEFAKSVEGPQIAELIGLDVIRTKCPHFDAWLTRLEKLVH
jgi:hypothetical protein